MLRTFIFLNSDTDEELRLPVTPEGFAVETGRSVLTLDMADGSQANLPGAETLFSRDLSFWLPARPAAYASASWRTPYAIVATLENWIRDGNVVRYIISGTPVDVPVLLSNLRFAEEDGTNDVYCTLTMKKYRYLQAASVVSGEDENLEREDDQDAAGSGDISYVVQEGDCLWTICERFYGDGTRCYWLAAYNDLNNVNLVTPGQVILIPDRATLDTVRPRTPAKQPDPPLSVEQIKADARAWKSKHPSKNTTTTLEA